MSVTEDVAVHRKRTRAAGIERWHDWLTDHLSGKLTVEELGWRETTGGAVWKVRFPEAGERKVYVAPDALALETEDFEEAVSSLDPVELVTRLKVHPHRVLRIRQDGRIETLN